MYAKMSVKTQERILDLIKLSCAVAVIIITAMPCY